MQRKFTKKELAAAPKRVVQHHIYEVELKTTWGATQTRRIAAFNYIEVVKIVCEQFSPETINSIELVQENGVWA